MAYTRRRRFGIRRRRYTRRNYGRYRRATIYRRRTATVARRAYSKARYALRKAKRISRTLDYQIYYNYVAGTNSITNIQGLTTASTTQGNGYMQIDNAIPNWYRGQSQAMAGANVWNSYNAVPSLGVGPKGWGLNTSPYAFVQGDKLRVKNIYLRLNLEMWVDNTKWTAAYIPQLKVRVCAFTYKNSSTYYPITSTTNPGYFDITAVQNFTTAGIQYEGDAQGDINLGQVSRVYPTNAQKIPGTTIFRKIYDKSFYLGQNRWIKKININAYRHRILEFDTDRGASVQSETGAVTPATLVPLQKLAFCILVDWPSEYGTTQGMANLTMNYQTMVRYYDQ